MTRIQEIKQAAEQAVKTEIDAHDAETRTAVLGRIWAAFHGCGERLNLGGYCPRCER